MMSSIKSRIERLEKRDAAHPMVIEVWYDSLDDDLVHGPGGALTQAEYEVYKNQVAHTHMLFHVVYDSGPDVDPDDLID